MKNAQPSPPKAEHFRYLTLIALDRPLVVAPAPKTGDRINDPS